jgi:hypothetical protein
MLSTSVRFDLVVDQQAMPRQLSLTGRGIGPFRHLDLDLTSEQSAELLYPL